MATSGQSRLYRGTWTGQRRAERRVQLMDAAIEIYGDVGYRNASVRAICERAKLTERYFYESFQNSEALLIATYRNVTDAMLEDMAAAARTEQTERARLDSVLRVYFTHIREKPRAARVFLLELAGISPAVDTVRSEVLRSMNRLIAGRKDGRPDGSKGKLSLQEAGVIGALLSISIRWLSHDCSQALADVVSIAMSHCTVGSSEALSTATKSIPEAKR